MERASVHSKVGGAKQEGEWAWGPTETELAAREKSSRADSVRFHLDRTKRCPARRCDGYDRLRSNLAQESPAKPWQFYIRLAEVEPTFQQMKPVLAIRPISHLLWNGAADDWT